MIGDNDFSIGNLVTYQDFTGVIIKAELKSYTPGGEGEPRAMVMFTIQDKTGDTMEIADFAMYKLAKRLR